MTDIWLDKPDNPGMDDYDLSADDVSGVSTSAAVSDGEDPAPPG
ncbi:hypothetical protein [Gordonia terrae]|nr:hypothetical protein [Gordonia terrae]